MTRRACDMPPEEQQAYYEQLRRTFERVDEFNADMEERAGQRRLDGAELEERYAARQRQERERAATPQPAPVSPITRAPARDWKAGERWIEGIIDRKLRAFAGMLGQAEGEATKEDRALMRQEIEDRIAKSDAATVELLIEMERRLATLEQRAMLKPQKPKLVGSDDAA